MNKYFFIPIFLLLTLFGTQAQTLPTTSEQWLKFFLNANSNSLIPLERDFANTMISWQKKLAVTSNWREEQESLTLLAQNLQAKDVQMLEYLLLQEAFHLLGLQDVYEPTMWLVDASKKAQASNANRQNPFTALGIPSSENKLVSTATSLFNKAQSVQQMSHIERVFRLLTTLQKLPESQQLNILSIFFGKEKSQRILPMVKVADKALSQYDHLKTLKAKLQEFQEMMSIANLKSFYDSNAYQKLLQDVFGKPALTSLTLPQGDDPQGMVLALMSALIQNKSNKQALTTRLQSIYLHPKVVPLLLEVSDELKAFMKIS